jgi:hypothetical protein
MVEAPALLTGTSKTAAWAVEDVGEKEEIRRVLRMMRIERSSGLWQVGR